MIEKSVIVDLLASSTAGLIARFICHPIDTIKSKLQSGKIEYKSFYSTISKTFKVDGIRGYYRGIGAVLVGGIPGVSLYLTAYEQFKVYFSQYNKNLPSFIVPLSAGMCAETLSCIVFVPVDVIKERLQVQSSSSSALQNNPHMIYKNSFDALYKIAKYEGIGGVYKGYGATLLSYGPFSAVYFTLYELQKEALLARGNDSSDYKSEEDLSFNQALLWYVYSTASIAIYYRSICA